MGNSMRVTLADIQAHLKEKLPQLKQKGISRTTIHQLLVAPRKGTRNAQRYNNLISAKVPSKDNTQHKTNLDSHFAFAQVNYALEFCQKFSDEPFWFSFPTPCKSSALTT